MHLFIQYFFMVLKSGPLKKNDLKKLVAFEMRCYRKVLNITWKDKIRNEDVLHPVEAILAEEQAGFRPGRYTVEQVFALKMLIQHRIEKKDGKVFAVFKKAFDRVWHDGLFSVLQQYGVPRKLINIIRNLYSKAKSCIRVNNNLTDWFETTIGVRQGCLLSPDLFNLFLENILAEAFEDCKKLGINVDGYKLKDLRFAHDICRSYSDQNSRQLYQGILLHVYRLTPGTFVSSWMCKSEKGRHVYRSNLFQTLTYHNK